MVDVTTQRVLTEPAAFLRVRRATEGGGTRPPHTAPFKDKDLGCRCPGSQSMHDMPCSATRARRRHLLSNHNRSASRSRSIRHRISSATGSYSSPSSDTEMPRWREPCAGCTWQVPSDQTKNVLVVRSTAKAINQTCSILSVDAPQCKINAQCATKPFNAIAGTLEGTQRARGSLISVRALPESFPRRPGGRSVS